MHPTTSKAQGTRYLKELPPYRGIVIYKNGAGFYEASHGYWSSIQSQYFNMLNSIDEYLCRQSR